MKRDCRKIYSQKISSVKVSSPKNDTSASPNIIESVSVRMCAVTHNIITWQVEGRKRNLDLTCKQQEEK